MPSENEAGDGAAKARGVVVASSRPCPVCHCREGRYLHTMHFVLPEASPLPGSYDIFVCQGCACAFADSAASADDYSEYYRSQSKYEDEHVATGSGDAPADAARIEALATDLVRDLSLGARILDVGCGNGGLLRSLRERGYHDLTGVDPSPACAAHVRALGMRSVNTIMPLCGDAQRVVGTGHFDLIVLSHVLEHVFDAGAVLASLKPLLAAGGKIYIEVPDAERYETRQFPPMYFFDAEHINHFSLGSLEFLASSLQLAILDTGRKTLRLANGADYPALYAVLSLGDANDKTPIERCESLFGALEGYVVTSLAEVDTLRERVQSLIGETTPFVLWGAGSLAQRLVGERWFPVRSLKGIVDRDSKKQGMRFAGTMIASPEEGLRDLPAGTVVLCAAAIATDQIEMDYRSLGHVYPFHSVVG